MGRSLCFLLALAAGAATPATVDDLIATVRNAIERQQADAHIAAAVRKTELAERLEWSTVEELETEGAGPKTIDALQTLLDGSQSLAASAHSQVFPGPPAPNAAEQARVLEAAARNSLNYAATLPDFLCTETVRRYEDFKGKERENWTLKDTLTLKLSYFSHAEDYKLVAINGHPTYRSYEDVGGAMSEGEFGSLLISLFRDAEQRRFTWDHWTTLRGRRALVYRFRIRLEESSYNVQFASAQQGAITVRSGQSGFIEVDRETGRVLRVYAVAEDIPPDFPVTNVTTLLDYDFVEISGQRFLLPLHALVRMGTARVQTRNEVFFEDYRKFASESNITFH